MGTLTEQAIKLLFKDTAFQYDLVYSTFFFSNKKGGLEIPYPERGPRPFTCTVSSDKSQYINTGKEQEAYNLLVKAKESGEQNLFFLAICFFNGFGVKANKKEAIRLLEQGNDAICLYVLGYCYENKIVVGKDLTKAQEYYQKAFDLGSVDACNILLSYFKSKDQKKMISWQSKANELFKKINDSNDVISIRKVVEICGDGTLPYGGVRIPNLCKKGAKLGDAYCKLAYAMNSSVDSDLRKRCVDELCNKDYRACEIFSVNRFPVVD